MKDQISQILQEHFQITRLEIRDDSVLHAGHAEAQRSGGGHFFVLIVAVDFEGKSPLERHRMVYGALKEELQSRIHAIAVKAMTPEEFEFQK